MYQVLNNKLKLLDNKVPTLLKKYFWNTEIKYQHVLLRVHLWVQGHIKLTINMVNDHLRIPWLRGLGAHWAENFETIAPEMMKFLPQKGHSEGQKVI